MKKVAIIIGTYLPGYKAGGPVRTINNLVKSLYKKYEFYIVTSDRDLGEKSTYKDIQSNKWIDDTYAKIYYAYKGNFTIPLFLNIDKKVDLFYICGCYNLYSIKAVLLLKLKLLRSPIIIAPMGGTSTGAIKTKKIKKQIFYSVSNFFKLYKDVNWSVTSLDEKENLLRLIKTQGKIFIAQDIPLKNKYRMELKFKERKRIELIFLSRISETKNLLFLLDCLKYVTGNVNLNIYGNIEDKDYWNECKNAIGKLPPNIKVNYCGEAGYDKVIEYFQKNQLFVFPTKCENFGHVILEAMSGGCPVVISNNTPFEFVGEEGVVIPLSQPKSYIEVIQKFIDMDNEEYTQRSCAAFEFYCRFIDKNKSEKEYMKMFESV